MPGRGDTRRTSLAGLVVFLLSSSVFFAALAVVFWLRWRATEDWSPVPFPSILYVNTTLLAGSSGALEGARAALRHSARAAFSRWWRCGTLLGVTFLLGQAYAWRQLARSEIFIATSPAGSFFYLLTGIHAVHVFAGLAILAYVDVQALRLRLGPAKRTLADLGAIFWHFLDTLWIVLFLLLRIWS